MASFSGRSWWLLAALAAGLVVGCGEKPPEVSQNKFRPAGANAKPADQPADQPAEKPAAKPSRDPSDLIGGNTPTTPPAGDKPPKSPAAAPAAEPIVVPDGTPAKLFAYVEKLEEEMIKSVTQAEQLDVKEADLKKMVVRYRQGQIAAVDKVLAQADAKEDHVQAASMKLQYLQQVASFGVATKPTYQEFVAELAKSPDPQLARLGLVGTFASFVDEYMKQAQAEMAKAPDKEEFQPSPELSAKAKELATKVEELIAGDDPNAGIMKIATQGAGALMQTRQFRAAAALFAAIHAKFKDSKDPQTAFSAGKLEDQVFVAHLVGAISGDETLMPEVMAAFEKKLEKADEETYSLAQQALMMFEMTGHVPEAKKLLDLMVKGYASTENKEIKQAVATLKEKAEKRLALLGKPIAIEGVRTSDGKPFDWKEYEGKVVLIDLWATWCRPCLAELPSVYDNYQKYHDQGFEVVGINLDEDPEALPKFTKQVPQIFQKYKIASIPWTTVVQGDPNNAGMEKDPNALRFGVEAIPFMLLVGRDGNVIAMHPRGKKLGQLLAKEFPAKTPEGTPEEKPAEKAGEKNAEKPASAPVESGAVIDLGGATFVVFADEPADKPADAKAEEVNPYSPDAELTTPQLIEFLFNMEDRPKAIRMRPGFAAAVCEACDRILAAQPNPKQREIAATTEFAYLHRDASLGDDKADKLLIAFAAKLKEESNPAIARWVKLVELEQEALASDKLDKEKLPELIAKVKAYFEAETLLNEHLRLASACVGAINRLEDGKTREKHFLEIGGILAKSKDQKLASYGKKLAKPPEGEAETDLVGKPLDLKGERVDGEKFAWKEYRGKYVIVDFWATWCGPCKREMPHVKALHEKYKNKGVEVIGVSLDEEVDDLKTYIEENQIPWPNLNGEEASNTAKQYGVRGIPTFMLIDKEGKIVALGHAIAPLEAKLAELVK